MRLRDILQRTSSLTFVAPAVVGVAVALGGYAASTLLRTPPAQAQLQQATNPCAAANPCAANPCAANPCAANPCAANPCAANPCAANPCAANPCAANPCAANPCAANPCAASPCAPAGMAGVSDRCFVPRLASAQVNPCAANPCAANPCAANPCAANPCAANPCAANPCAANPCAANPCAANPCAANPCAANPCAANPCAANPCAANPCAANPCAANPCAPCGPAAQAPELSDHEAAALFHCLMEEMREAYGKSGHPDATAWAEWSLYSTAPYLSGTHGERLVHNYANAAAANYGRFEEAGTFTPGAKLAKPSISVTADGKGVVGPLFLMEKMPAGFRADSDDWRYTMIMADGALAGTTNGAGAQNVEFCIACHKVVTPELDNVLLLPFEYRVNE